MKTIYFTFSKTAQRLSDDEPHVIKSQEFESFQNLVEQYNCKVENTLCSHNPRTAQRFSVHLNDKDAGPFEEEARDLGLSPQHM